MSKACGAVGGRRAWSGGPRARGPPGTASPIRIGSLDSLGGTTSFSAGCSINKAGVAVGQAYRQSAETCHGFIWSAAEGLIDLNDRLMNAPPGLIILGAIRINCSGLIAATSNAGAVILKPGLGGATRVSASIMDANAGDTHTASWNWGDGSICAGTVTESGGKGSVAGTTRMRKRACMRSP